MKHPVSYAVGLSGWALLCPELLCCPKVEGSHFWNHPGRFSGISIAERWENQRISLCYWPVFENTWKAIFLYTWVERGMASILKQRSLGYNSSKMNWEFPSFPDNIQFINICLCFAKGCAGSLSWATALLNDHSQLQQWGKETLRPIQTLMTFADL